MKKRDLSKYYPPGYDYQRWNSYAIIALVVLAFAVLIAYSGRFSDAYSKLDWNRYHTEILSGSTFKLHLIVNSRSVFVFQSRPHCHQRR